MLYYMSEEQYRAFSWCRRSLDSVIEQARKRRIRIASLENMKDISDTDPEAAVVLLCCTENWMQEKVWEADTRRVHPIVLTNRDARSFGAPFSLVTMDLAGNMKLAIEHLWSIGCRRLALYGVNPSATSDPCRAEVFQRLTGQKDCYAICNDMRETYWQFKSHLEEYDGIICTNDYTAISLLDDMEEDQVPTEKQPRLVSFGDFNISKIHRPSVTSVVHDYSHFGWAVMEIYRAVIKEHAVSSMTISLRGRLEVRETTGHATTLADKIPKCARSDKTVNRFFRDEGIADMGQFETLLDCCDETDLAIIRRLVHGEPYAHIAEHCFLSDTTVKYHVKNMLAACGLSTREELQKLLRKFL